jgi:hypothetical protein
MKGLRSNQQKGEMMKKLIALIVCVMFMACAGAFGVKSTNFNKATLDGNGNEITIGMTYSEVRSAWGAPTKIKKFVNNATYIAAPATAKAYEDTIFWYYGDMQAGDSQMWTITFDKGIVTKITFYKESS